MQPEIPANDDPLNGLLDVMARLRDPAHGCPWDIKQTWRSILPYTIEETYEVVDAIERNDVAALQEELGDLLLQIVFMAQIAKEQGLFDFHDVARGIRDKMVRRHPHVFGDARFANEQEQKQAWEAIKQQERQGKPQYDDFFAGIPLALPALRRSQKLQQRAAQVGFDWNHWQQVLPKIHEELEEVQAAIAQGEPPTRIEEEVGDVLMGATNLARLLGVNAENALRVANRKFEQRFRAMAMLLQAQGLSLETADLAQMEAAWQLAKAQEKQAPL